MVMAAGSLCRQRATVELPHETAGDAAALHERLVAYVHSLAPSQEVHSGVWVEHSYARTRTSAPPSAAHVRALLAPPPHDDIAPALVDVLSDAPPPAQPADSTPPHSDDDDEDEDEQWEARVKALAPAAAHALLAERALEALRALRLARLARAHEPVRVAARRLRHALVAAPRAGPWLHATLPAHAPRYVRRLYDEATAELRRMAPRLAERALGAGGPVARRSALERVGPLVGPDGSPWLLWLSGGSARQDRRWRRRLGALVHTRVLAAPTPSAAAPDAWCASVASSMRAALVDALAEAGERAVVLGGSGAGAALCAALAGTAAGSGRVRGLLLLAPPLRTAEGARDASDEPLAELRLPLLLVAGARAAQSWRGALRRAAVACDARHVLEVCGADDALRLPAHARRALRLSQHALDAAVADECARWALHAVEGEAPRAPPARRRAAAPDEHDAEEYAHLPSAAAVRHERAAEVTGEGAGEGRVVSRGSGGTPLALLPPRRAAPPATPPALAAADIMRLPIVFADDEAVEPDASPGAVTVTSGGAARRGGGAYTRVIVASRGGAGAGAARGARGARPLLLRRTVRIVPRHAPQR